MFSTVSYFWGKMILISYVYFKGYLSVFKAVYILIVLWCVQIICDEFVLTANNRFPDISIFYARSDQMCIFSELKESFLSSETTLSLLYTSFVIHWRLVQVSEKILTYFLMKNLLVMMSVQKQLIWSDDSLQNWEFRCMISTVNCMINSWLYNFCNFPPPTDGKPVGN